MGWVGRIWPSKRGILIRLVNQYFADIPCTYSVWKLDISRIKAADMKIYPAMIHYIATVVNRHEEFRTAYGLNNRVGIYDVLNPSYTIFHKDTETFSTIWSEYSANYEQFLANFECKVFLPCYLKDIKHLLFPVADIIVDSKGIFVKSFYSSPGQLYWEELMEFDDGDIVDIFGLNALCVDGFSWAFVIKEKFPGGWPLSRQSTLG